MSKNGEIVALIIAIIFLIVIVLYVYFIGLTTSKPMELTSTYTVTLDPENQCYLIDGEKKKDLVLKRNTKYKFVINTPDHPFIFTSSPEGGSLDGSIIKDTHSDFGLAENGDFEIIIDKNTKSEFYYQSLKDKNYGGKIIIK